MKTIYKYAIGITDEQAVTMPRGAKILSAGLDPQGNPCVWAEVDTDEKDISVTIEIFGTGNPIQPHPRKFIGTFVDDVFVWHVYEKGRTD